MDENTFLEPVEALPPSNSGEEHAPDAGPRPEQPTVTFMGNVYDLTSMGALASGVLMLFMCLTCNMGVYCLPLVPLLLGAIGLLSARQAVNEERTRLWSWIGLGSGGVVLLLVVLAVVAYLGLMIIALLAPGKLE